MKTTFYYIGLMIFPFFIISCEKEESTDITESTLPTITEWVQSQSSEYDSLKLALSKAGLYTDLNSPGSFTLFAQPNGSFNLNYVYQIPPYISDVPDSLLRVSMQKNILNGRYVLSESKPGDYYSTLCKTAPANRAQMYYINYKLDPFSNQYRINGGVAVSEANIKAKNGYIHIIDRLLSSRSLGDLITDNDSLSELMPYITYFNGDFTNIILNIPPHKNKLKTFFAPSNQAIREFVAADTSINSLNQLDTTTLKRILDHHLVMGTQLTYNQFSAGPLKSRNGDDLTIGFNNGLTITSSSGVTAKIIRSNIQGEHGIMHIIDKVLSP